MTTILTILGTVVAVLVIEIIAFLIFVNRVVGEE